MNVQKRAAMLNSLGRGLQEIERLGRNLHEDGASVETAVWHVQQARQILGPMLREAEASEAAERARIEKARSPKDVAEQKAREAKAKAKEEAAFKAEAEAEAEAKRLALEAEAKAIGQTPIIG